MRSMSPATLETIDSQGISPSILYGIVGWGNCSAKLLNDVEKYKLKQQNILKESKRVPDSKVLSIIYYLLSIIANWVLYISLLQVTVSMFSF